MTKNIDELWGELVPGYGEADTMQGEMVRCIVRLSHELLTDGYYNYEFNKYEYNRKLIEHNVSDDEIIARWKCDDKLCIEGELLAIIDSGIFEMTGNSMIEAKKLYDNATTYDYFVNYLKSKLPDYAGLIEKLRVDVPFGAASPESRDIIMKLYLESFDSSSEEYLNNASSYDDEMERCEEEVTYLIEDHPQIVPLMDKLRPFIQISLIEVTENNLEENLEEVESIIVDYCNSHRELIDLKKDEIDA